MMHALHFNAIPDYCEPIAIGITPKTRFRLTSHPAVDALNEMGHADEDRPEIKLGDKVLPVEACTQIRQPNVITYYKHEEKDDAGRLDRETLEPILKEKVTFETFENRKEIVGKVKLVGTYNEDFTIEKVLSNSIQYCRYAADDMRQNIKEQIGEKLWRDVHKHMIDLEIKGQDVQFIEVKSV